MGLSVSQFVERLVDSGILEEPDLEAVRRAVVRAGDGDAEVFVKAIVKEGRLTAYQARRLWKNRGRELVLGNYVVEDEIGQGGIGVVLKARHRRMKRHVAIKLLGESFVKDAGAIARFHREVEAAARLSHPNIVAAHDADEIDGRFFLVMEYVDGRDLATVVKKHGPLGVEQAVDAVLQAARGLEYAHERGVVHRDVKPANLLLDANGTVKILDMGLARLDEKTAVGTRAELTGTGTVMGTVDYMSPEQAKSTKTADARSDVYSLGMTLFYLLTGRPAYGGDTLIGRLLSHRDDPVPSLREHVPGVSEHVDRVFARMVAKRAEDRYASMASLIADLEAGNATAAEAPSVLDAVPVPASLAAGREDGMFAFLQSLDESDPNVGAGSEIRGHSGGSSVIRDEDPAGGSDTGRHSATAVEVPPKDGGAASSASSVHRARHARHGRRRGGGGAWYLDPRLFLAGGGAVALLALALAFGSGGPDGTLELRVLDDGIAARVEGTKLSLKNAGTKLLAVEPGKYTVVASSGTARLRLSIIVPRRKPAVVELGLDEGDLVATRDGEELDRAVAVIPEPDPDPSPAANTGLTPKPPTDGFDPFRMGGPGERLDPPAAFLTAKHDHRNGLDFNGAGQVVNGTIVVDPAGPLTIEAWVTPQMPQPENNVVAQVGVARIAIAPEGVWAFEGTTVEGLPAFRAAESTGSYEMGRLVHVAGVRDGDAFRLYVDGRQRAAVAVPDVELLANHVALGTGERNLVGRIHEFRISTAARYGDDFEPEQSLAVDDDTLVLYHFDLSEGLTVWDASRNGHHGRIQGATWFNVGAATE